MGRLEQIWIERFHTGPMDVRPRATLERTRGRVLRIGTCRLRIAGETRPCTLMEETHGGLQAAMANRCGGGVFAEVLSDGEIAIGDTITWEDPEGSSDD